uniref:RING-type E3 ubiquitin transferase n=1 Tax=Anser cygnoides TaxID=8845 RepID=A0A8B9IK60_ANSCY
RKLCRLEQDCEPPWEALATPLPPRSWALLAFPRGAQGALGHSARLSWQDMASGAEERLEESSPAARGSSSQLQQAGPAEDAADCPCPICLDIITDAAYVARCFHRFCSTCIRRWSRQNNTCPLCRQPIDPRRDL